MARKQGLTRAQRLKRRHANRSINRWCRIHLLRSFTEACLILMCQLNRRIMPDIMWVIPSSIHSTPCPTYQPITRGQLYYWRRANSPRQSEFIALTGYSVQGNAIISPAAIRCASTARRHHGWNCPSFWDGWMIRYRNTPGGSLCALSSLSLAVANKNGRPTSRRRPPVNGTTR